MATSKSTRSRKRRKAVHKRRKAVPSGLLRIPEVKGKTVEAVEIDSDAEAISIVFQDKTLLSFDLDPGLTVFPELSTNKSGDWRPIKRWPAMHSRISMVKWP